mgnify:FL=1|jgi:hypothetical protein|tara:strand:- start:1345 stop:1518 length:174 start_codon:yes stop_codon:yes gene_type:complete
MYNKFNNLSLNDRINFIENNINLLQQEYIDIINKINLYNKKIIIINYLFNNITKYIF